MPHPHAPLIVLDSYELPVEHEQDRPLLPEPPAIPADPAVDVLMDLLQAIAEPRGINGALASSITTTAHQLLLLSPAEHLAVVRS